MKLHTVTVPGTIIAALVFGLLSVPAFGGTFTANYLGGGIWEQDGGAWSTTAYPQNGRFVLINGNAVPDNSPIYNVAINNAAPCTLGTFVNVETVNVSNGSTLNLGPTGFISLWTNGSLGNAGLITINATSSGSGLRMGADSSVVNGGEVFMNDSPNNTITGGAPGKIFTVFAGGRIRGAGALNQYLGDDRRVYMQFVNRGLIEAMQPVNSLRINLTDQAGINGLINDGTLRARGEAVLRITPIFTANGTGNVLNQGGTIEAIDNGKVRVASGVTLEGGTVTTTGNGAIQGDYPGNGGGTLKDLTNTGVIAILDREAISLAGTLIDNGSITLSSVGNGATLRFANGTTLAGNGAVTLSNNGSNYLMAAGFGDALTIGPTATVQGAGNISPGFSGGSNMLKITNQGLIHANLPGAALGIRAEESNGTPFTNTGTLRASNGGALSFNGTSTLTNRGNIQVVSGSTISAGGGITLLQTAGTIDLGGSINFPLGLDLNGGQLIGTGTFSGPIRNNGGVVSPGRSPGRLTVSGDYMQGAGGAMNMEIGGTTAGTGYDQLVATGKATLGGTLNITAINGFKPIVGDSYTLVSAGSFAGSFANVNFNGFTGKIDSSSNGITLTITTTAGQLLNVATRMRVNPDPNQLIGGFIITGTDPKRIVIRATGPSLSRFFSGVLGDPTLEVFQGGTLLASNDNWKENDQANIEATGVAPRNDLESAIVRTFAPGAYTAIVRGKNGTRGIGLVEAYDLSKDSNSSLANIATRGFVDIDDNVMIGGFIISRSSGSQTRVVIRAIGPSLTAFGVEGALADPTLELRDANGSLLRENDNWKDSQQSEIEAAQLTPRDERESAIFASLNDGSYTAIVRGKGNTKGVGLVEVYLVP